MPRVKVYIALRAAQKKQPDAREVGSNNIVDGGWLYCKSCQWAVIEEYEEEGIIVEEHTLIATEIPANITLNGETKRDEATANGNKTQCTKWSR